MKFRNLITGTLLCVALSGCGPQVTEPEPGPSVRVTGPRTGKTDRSTSEGDSTETGQIKRSDQQRQKRADL
jgi:hypothetical protein